MYRPQFPYPVAPAKCEDLRCTYSFDPTNTPQFQGTIANGVIFQQVPLLLDKDADFFLLAVQVNATALQIGLMDQGGHPLLNPTSPGLPPALAAPLWCQCDGGPITALESDTWGIYFKAGARLYAYVQNSSGGGLTGPTILIHGRKRFKGMPCR